MGNLPGNFNAHRGAKDAVAALACASNVQQPKNSTIYFAVDFDASLADLAKELDRLSSVKDFEGLECKGGALDGARLDAGDIKRVAKWPTRSEQLSILSGQISGLASTLSGQILAVGGMLAGQISSRVEDLEKEAGGEAPAA